VEAVVTAAARAAHWRGRPVFVTGATGFVGGWLSRALVELGARVVCLVRDLRPRSVLVQSGLVDRVVTVRGGLDDVEALEQALRKYDAETCFHLAAEAIVSVANASPVAVFEANIRGAWHVLEAARRAGSVRRVVLASSDKVYGSRALPPYREELALESGSPYEVSKACADLLARAYFRSYGLPTAVARFGNVYGGGDLNFSRLVPGTIAAVLRREAPVLRSDGRSLRDFLYVDDAVHAYLGLAERLHEPGVQGEAFNFGTGAPTQVLALVEKVIALGGDARLRPVIVGDGTDEARAQYVSIEKTHAVLGWTAGWSLDRGLDAAFRWYERFLLEAPVAARGGR
jgi:CDP-glucose 4,6-dehydratase